MAEFEHIPVMLKEVIDGLCVKPDGVYIDCTVGGAGHSIEIARRLGNGKLYCIDKDYEALSAAKDRLAGYNAELIHGDFKQVLKQLPQADGILMDLGVSSHQLDTAERGFSYRLEGELDMRMDATQGVSAKEVVNTFPPEKLIKIFFEYGEERYSKSIAYGIVEARAKAPINTTTELCNVIKKSIPTKALYSGSNPYMRVFQALRIFVNGELEGLDESISTATDRLKPQGRLCVITFHSLEDRAVKTKMKFLELSCICPPSCPVCICGKKSLLSIITKKPITASQEELGINRRAECAKLRIAEKKETEVKNR